MRLQNSPKFFILVLALSCVTLLLALGKITTEAGLPLISACVFYGIGNGVAARGGTSSEPILGPKQKRTK